MNFEVYLFDEQQAMEYLKQIRQVCKVCRQRVAMFPPDVPIRHTLLHLQGEERAKAEKHLAWLESLTTFDVLSMIERYGLGSFINDGVPDGESC